MFFGILVIGIFLSSCTALPYQTAESKGGTMYERPYSGTSKPAKTSVNKQPEQTGTALLMDGLNGQSFQNLPQPIQSYLHNLSKAFTERDKVFLLRQADPFFQKKYRAAYSDEEYLALLYRIGSYSRESPDEPVTRPVLRLEKVRGIFFTSSEDLGAVIEVQAFIRYTDGRQDPCRLIILPHLAEPKIRGFEP
ncbi:MAG: hypothetical protein SNJ56_02320 [Termitinemataceae bacterium]